MSRYRWGATLLCRLVPRCRPSLRQGHVGVRVCVCMLYSESSMVLPMCCPQDRPSTPVISLLLVTGICCLPALGHFKRYHLVAGPNVDVADGSEVKMRCAFSFRWACSRGLLTCKHSADTRLVGYMILPAQASTELTALVPLEPQSPHS